ncbi:MAG: ABC transporter permease [Firmicutes bacterium]|nr:ABC transporter permease [Bacillota bacterium]
MENKNKKGIGYLLLYITLPVIILLIWEGFNQAGVLKPYTMPSLAKLFETTIEYAENGQLFENIGVSVLLVLEGFFLALVTALIMGMLVSLFPKFDIFTDLVIQILKPIPPIAWIPLAILWFGIGQESKIFIIFIGAVFPIFLNTVDGVKTIDKKYFELAKVYEIPRSQLIKNIVIPGALPSIMTGIRVGLGNAWVSVVAAEMIGATKGVGYMLSNGRSLSRPDIVILGMLLVGIFGKIMDDILKFLRRKVITWL